MAELELRAIEKSYGEHAVVNRVSLNIHDGEFLTLVGPSGCGKSTLLRIIAGLEAQDSGEVRMGGNCVDDERPKERDIAMVFQTYALYPHLTVFDNIALPLRARRLNFVERLPLLGYAFPRRRRLEQAIRTEVQEAAAMLDLAHLLHRKPGQLSGGQRQRVALGRAMVRHPAVFLMDEPLSNLDAKLRVQMRTEITALHRRLGVTFVYVTHDQSEAMTMSDRIAVMLGGELLQVAPPEVLYRDPQDLRVAEMIGSPKINVVSCTSWIALGGGLPAGMHEKATQIAFRPEDPKIAAPSHGAVRGVVASIENLGSDIFLNVTLANDAGSIVIRTRPDAPRFEPSRSVGLSVDPARLMQFDSLGRRLNGIERAAA
ncbi:ABC transporter ATP-binding protein [Pseudorhodoplanes sinuspersici]|uniref:Glycerol-3-phosphate ABC transporter ATP-binding protein n=1 Tax=Pseudorhodoplanes sinuspersici TaxID=1235591 RepID=A0A1W6ZRA2_9HYPH|nr:ABC transporter ATP-binding protein [Pseudorhodoplanes sinuspersici]ARP99650.1 glycerol-3-phosphate ABC transporter ATP-binding protein [Pseudorhodoplanes sinuspersici]RKE70628.1 carbohydrate ABC transporter ATP-binding protein (CUT1 family) [Pseudorhodoplanes sinuspersici]